jgi:hypothetical protein
MIDLSDTDRTGGHVWSKTDFLEVDGKFGPLTRAKVREYQQVFGLSVDGAVGPETNASLFAPQADQVDQAQGIALNWTLIAKGAVQSLRAWVQSLRAGRPAPTANLAVFLEALSVHFHLDLPRPLPPAPGRAGPSVAPVMAPVELIFADQSLSFIQQVFDDVSFVLEGASIREGRVFHSVGFFLCDALKIGTISAALRNVPGRHGKVILVCFPPSFAVTTAGLEFFRTPHQQASTVLHECCHYVRPPSSGADHLLDFAYGLPAFDGEPAKGRTRNYRQLFAEEALKNAESYNLFAEHVTFGRDTRFGRLQDDAATFACGSKDFCN